MATNSQMDEISDRAVSNEFLLKNMDEHMSINPSQLADEVVREKDDPKVGRIKHKKIDSKKYQKGVEDNPEYFRVDHQITHKLYEIYRRLKIGPNQQSEGFSFEEREQSNTTMNYHKIMQIFKDLDIKLEINQKLQILRAIKKFCFTQNFINEEEFIKIFKVIVHAVGFKEVIFKPLIQSKYTSVIERDTQNVHKRGLSIKVNKNFAKKLKTEPEIENIRSKYYVSQVLKDGNKTIQTITHAEPAKKVSTYNPHIMEESKVTTARMIQSRKRLMTDASRYESPPQGYLNRAIEKNKIGKITWDNLFKMTEETMHHNISIPNFISQDINLTDIYY